VTLLSEGMSSAAYRGSVAGTSYVIRVGKNDGRRPQPRYEAEARLLDDLADRGVPVARARTCLIDRVLCSIAPELPGHPVQPEDWTPTLLDDLGKSLRIVHQTDPALAVQREVLARFHLARIWPFDGSSLTDHPIAARWPERVATIASQAEAILDAGAAPATVVHTDLHWDHLLVTDGRLTGILDFGDAFAGPAAWDDACLRYYHGPAVADLGDEPARLLGIAFALYKLAKTPERDDVVDRVDSML